jgi:hypothetical protein
MDGDADRKGMAGSLCGALWGLPWGSGTRLRGVETAGWWGMENLRLQPGTTRRTIIVITTIDTTCMEVVLRDIESSLVSSGGLSTLGLEGAVQCAS